MRTFLIHCKLPDTASTAFSDLISIIQKVNAELNLAGNKCNVIWRQSFLTNNRMYCIYSSTHSLAYVKENVPIANLITHIEEISDSTEAVEPTREIWYSHSKKLLEKNIFKF